MNLEIDQDHIQKFRVVHNAGWFSYAERLINLGLDIRILNLDQACPDRRLEVDWDWVNSNLFPPLQNRLSSGEIVTDVSNKKGKFELSTDNPETQKLMYRCMEEITFYEPYMELQKIVEGNGIRYKFVSTSINIPKFLYESLRQDL
jgi:hypothetical protein